MLMLKQFFFLMILALYPIHDALAEKGHEHGHRHHEHMSMHHSSHQAGGYKKSTQKVSIPNVVLINQNGERVKLTSILEDDQRLVVVDFIFASCATICPMLSAGFADFQQRLGTDREKVHLVSISIDPENDTPSVMRKHLAHYGAKPGWDFYSGSQRDIHRVMKAFHAYATDKMTHEQLIFIRDAEKDQWIRLKGEVSGTDLMQEVQRVGLNS